MVSKLIRILGIDPGSVTTGYGLIESDGIKNQYIAHGHINCKEATLAERVSVIYRKLDDVIDQWQPEEAAVEEIFVSRNAASALKLGHARGVAMCACVNRNLPVSEYAARLVKQAVVGKGSASKEQIQHMIRILLGLRGDIQADAADGLAVAICHAHSRFTKYGIRLPVTRRKRARA